MPASTTDRIEKKVFLKSPRSRVWRALTDAGEFGSWFGVRFEGAFLVANVWLNGRLLGSHYGYFAPFSFDISSFLLEENVLKHPPGDPDAPADGPFPKGNYANSPGVKP